MRRRKSLSKRASKKMFKKTASRTRRENIHSGILRGGRRL